METTKLPTLADLIIQHVAEVLAPTALVDESAVISVIHGMRTHAITAEAIVRSINKFAGTKYTLDDVDASCYYGSTTSIDLFRECQEGSRV